MADTQFAGSSFAVRGDLAESHARAWAAIAAPGTWLTGARRVAVAAEIRQARRCAHCARIREALSPNGVPGAHESLGGVGPAEVELIHRAVGDPGRLGEKWSQAVLARGLSEGEYVEIVGLIAMVMMMDTFTRALGAADTPLPAPLPGEPSRYRPTGAKKKAAWLPITEPWDATEADGPMYPNPRAGYIYRALSLVPQSLRDYWALASCHYLPGPVIYQFGQSVRAIRRPQVEVIAARVSAMHQCVY
jgi:alkylhydroperoxidase family enzyme